MKEHAIHFLKSVTVGGPYKLKQRFEDNTEQAIDFEPVLLGQLYGPLRDLKVFNQVRIDAELRTIVWPNAADFDSASLHDWPTHAPKLIELAKSWEVCPG